MANVTPMRVLITGATGFIGGHMAEELHEHGHELRCLVRQTSNIQWIKHLPIDYVYGDLFNEKAIADAVKDMDYVYHLAGITKARIKAEYFRGNHEATRNLLRICLDVNPRLKRFIHVSSQAAVGPSLNGAPVDEQTPFHPITTYGKSKMEAEKECLGMMDQLPITVVRPPAVYGPRDRDVFEFFNAMNRGLHPMIGFASKMVSLIHVRDLVRGIRLAGEHPNATGQTYFISSERYYNWKEIGEITSRIMKKKVFRIRIPEFGVYTVATFSELFSLMSRKAVLLNFEKARDIVQNTWTCDISKAKRDLGYRETLTLEQGIENTVTWYRQQAWLK